MELEDLTTTEQFPLAWEEAESTANFTCRICMKTFYNKNALQKHKYTQHDDVANVSDDEYKPQLQPQRMNLDQDFEGLCGFKFIPLTKYNTANDRMGRNGLTTRIFTEDTTYLIIKLEGNDYGDGMKKTKLEGAMKRPNPKVKQPVDLRGPFTCTFPSAQRPDKLCCQIFFNCCDYSVHYREEHTKRRKAALRCQVCEKRLDRDFDPIEVIAAPQNVPTQCTFSCRICGKIFINSNDFDEHNRVEHAKTKPHQCRICAKRFTQQGGLQQHMRMHTGIRPFICTYCPKAFTQKAGLDQHLRTHTKVKPFKCVICSKCFSQSVHLRQHMRTHTNIQPFECNVCNRRFKQSSHLNFHMRSHIGDGSIVVNNYVQSDGNDEFLQLANLQPVQHGDTLYYTTELAAGIAEADMLKLN